MTDKDFRVATMIDVHMREIAPFVRSALVGLLVGARENPDALAPRILSSAKAYANMAVIVGEETYRAARAHAVVQANVQIRQEDEAAEKKKQEKPA